MQFPIKILLREKMKLGKLIVGGRLVVQIAKILLVSHGYKELSVFTLDFK
jgi:hypothetical protein